MTSVIINNYNYGRFLSDAIASVLNQSSVPDEIIVVDDGSTDSSVAIVNEEFSHVENLKFVIKRKNEGQLSSFNRGYAVSTGDLVFFLDADDLYNERYLEEAVHFYETCEQCDFLFCGVEKFGNIQEVVFPYDGERDLGYSVALTFATASWIGNVTSTLSMRRGVLEKILPIPLEEDWRKWADDCLVWGASLAGARKYYMHKALVKYRVHGQNMSNDKAERESDVGQNYERRLRIERLFSLFRQRCGYHSDMVHLAPYEFRTIKSPTRQEFETYVRLIASSNLSLVKRTRMLRIIVKHFAAQRSESSRS